MKDSEIKEINKRANEITKEISKLFVGERVETVVWATIIMLEHLVRNEATSMDWVEKAMRIIGEYRRDEGSFGEFECVAKDKELN